VHRLEERDVIATAPRETASNPALVTLGLTAQISERGGCRTQRGAATYRKLTGTDPADAIIDDDDSFDGHVFASILAVATMESDAVAQLAGLAADDLGALIARWFPAAREVAAGWCTQASCAEDEEIAMVRGLLLANRSTEGDTGRWLASMIARRSMQPNHLWEDLGLRDRTELTRMLERHFFPIASRNTRNMRWKRFFYRMLCEDDGLVMCTTPVCSQCSDFDLCFGDESGESRLAYQRRLSDQKIVPLQERRAVRSSVGR
jgi:nitrogen fixation protein NifQ